MPAAARLTALLVVTCFGLGGCGGSAEPSPMPTVSTSASSSPTGPAEPELPQAAKADTKAGAVAFVKHYVALYNYAQATGDVSGLEAIGDPGCVSCASVVQRIRAIYGPGGEFEGGNWSIEQSTAVHATGGQWVVTIGGRIAPSVTSESGKPPESADGAKANVNFYVTFDHRWRVTQWKRF